MSLNSSSFSNASLHVPTGYDFLHNCVTSAAGAVSITAFSITAILLLLPLCILVLYLGRQRWQQQHSGTTMSHSDIFTYNMVIIELTNILGSSVTCCCVHTDNPQILMLCLYIWCINFTGQMLFHILTCLERYLAVIHPVTYLNLRKAKAIRFRNITIGCVWMMAFAVSGFMFVPGSIFITIVSFSLGGFCVITTSFCSISVLCVLTHPGLGQGGGNIQRVDQSKLRAFYTIMAILGVLVFRFGGSIIFTALSELIQVGDNEKCSFWFSQLGLSIPSSLVLPLLFLHRVEKLPCLKNSNKSG